MPDPVNVKVAGGAMLQCAEFFPCLEWMAADTVFTDPFQIHSLGSYDGIIGLDWLAKHSPMTTHWEQGWISFQYGHKIVLLCDERHVDSPHTVVELQLLQESEASTMEPPPPEIRKLLSDFGSVFEAPEGLPPSRSYDHHIPLIPGARPVSIRPYQVAPHLKTEIEHQIKELLAQGVIVHSQSAFSSPVLLVKKYETSDKSAHVWRLVVDYRHLNALTFKSRYPLPVIDELLDELCGAQWFSKLDLKAGYHQIRLAPGEEHKSRIPNTSRPF